MPARKSLKETAKPSLEEEIDEALEETPATKPARKSIPKAVRRPEREAELEEALEEAGATPAARKPPVKIKTPAPRAITPAPRTTAPATKATPQKSAPPAPKEEIPTRALITRRAKPREAAKPVAVRMAETINTKIDLLGKALEASPRNELSLEELARTLGVEVKSVERVGRVLQERGVMEVIYPVSVFAKATIRLLQPQKVPAKEQLAGERLLENYILSADGVPARVAVWQVKNETRPLYDIHIAQPGAYTSLYLDHLREKLGREVPILTEEITDPKKLLLLKQRFHDAATQAIEGDLPELEPHEKEVLSGMLLHKMYGLGTLELLMVDEKLEEIAVNSASAPISVYHKRIGWVKTTLQLETEEEIYNYASQIGRKAGRDITLLNPIMDAPLLTGDRATATLFPISSNGNTITIRRFARQPWTPTAFLDPTIKSISVEMAAFLWQAIQYEQNIIFAGGTASGKTSALNAAAMFIPPANRIISVEEVRELALPSFLRWNWVPFVTRGPNPEGKGEVNMLDLMVTSLRMRPDRIIVGEVRRGNEAEVLFEAMHTGHAVYSTLHADNAQQAVRRLTNPPISVPPIELETLQLFVVQYRDRRTGIRRTSEITELVPGVAGEVNLNQLYHWRARTDTFEKTGESVRVMNELSTHTGMTIDEIHEDLHNKESILDWMMKQGFKGAEQVGEVMNIYYRDPSVIEQAAAKNLPFEKVL